MVSEPIIRQDGRKGKRFWGKIRCRLTKKMCLRHIFAFRWEHCLSEVNHMEEYLGLTELLDQNLSAYEYFQTLPPEIQTVLRRRDSVSSFEELQAQAQHLRTAHGTMNYGVF